MTLLDEANALRQSIEELARDETAGAAQVQVLADAARAVGCQWARTPGDRPAIASMLACFGAWLDLEKGFAAGVRDAEDLAAEDAAHERAEALDAEDADYRLARGRDALLSTHPALAGWCARHPRATHVLAWPLFEMIDQAEHQAALSYVAEIDAETEPVAGGGLRLRLPGDAGWIHGESLVDVVHHARQSMLDR